MARRISTTVRCNATVDDSSQAADAALKFLGLVSNRANLVHTVANKTEKEEDEFKAQDVIRCLVNAMEESGVSISLETALHEDFVTKIGLFPAFSTSQPCDGFETFLGGAVDHLPFLAFGAELTFGARAAFGAIRQWIEAQAPPFPTSEDLQWFQREFSMCSDAVKFGTKPMPRGVKAKTDEFPPTQYVDKATQSDGDDGCKAIKTSSTSKLKSRQGRPGHPRFSSGVRIRAGDEVDSFSAVAILSVCQLIPLLYDRLIDVCDGSLSEAH